MPFQHKIYALSAYFHVTHKTQTTISHFEVLLLHQISGAYIASNLRLFFGYTTFEWPHDDIWNTAVPVGEWNS